MREISQRRSEPPERLGRTKPIHVGNVRLYQQVLIRERMQAAQQRPQQRGIVAIPIDLNRLGMMLRQPTRDVVGEQRRECGSCDTGDIGLLERQ